jgi:hypothetical protein
MPFILPYVHLNLYSTLKEERKVTPTSCQIHPQIHIENPTRCNSVPNFISYLYEAQHVSGDISPIIRRLKLHKQPLVLHTWKVVGREVAGR